MLIEERGNTIVESMAGTGIVVPICELHPFPNQPFKVVHDEAMESLVESIQQNGLLNRIIIRPRDAGGYEIIAGHRRVEAFRLLGYDTIPADLRRDLDDNAAVLAMIETNLRQRPKLLPSERAGAYRMMRDALLQQDNRPEVASEGGKRIRDEIGDLYGENPRQVTRYIRLTYLKDKLLTLVDTGKLKMGTAIAISYLNSETQAWVENYYEEKEVFPNNSQIKEIRRLSEAGTLTREDFDALMAGRPGKRKEPEDFIAGLREEYFPNLMDEDVKIKLRELVEEYFHRKNMLGY